MTSDERTDAPPEIASEDILGALNALIFSEQLKVEPVVDEAGNQPIAYHASQLTQGLAPEDIPGYGLVPSGSKEYWRRVALTGATFTTLLEEAFETMDSPYGEPGYKGDYWYIAAINETPQDEAIAKVKKAAQDILSMGSEARKPFLNRCMKRFETSHFRTNHLYGQAQETPHGSQQREHYLEAADTLVAQAEARGNIEDPSERALTMPEVPERF